MLREGSFLTMLVCVLSIPSSAVLAQPAPSAEQALDESEVQEAITEIAFMGARTGGEASSADVSLSTEDGLKLKFSGYLRPRFTMIEDDVAETDFVGRYDGFQLSNARLGVLGHYEDWSFKLSFDGAVDRRDSYNTSAGEVTVALKDAYASYAPWTWLVLTVGQYKPAFSAEELTSTRDLLFIGRSLPSRGVHGVEGINVDGQGALRELGLQLSGSGWLTGAGGFGLAYYLSMTNGSGANNPLNDNSKFAYYGRLEFVYDDMLTLGGAAFYNEMTTGRPPDELGEDLFGYTVDLRLDVFNVLVSGAFTQLTTSFPEVTAEPERSSQGYFASLGYRTPWGLVPAYRFASYDPTSAFSAEDEAIDAQLATDELTHHTIGLTWVPESLPLKIQLSYTLAFENEVRELANNRLDAALQLGF